MFWTPQLITRRGGLLAESSEVTPSGLVGQRWLIQTVDWLTH